MVVLHDRFRVSQRRACRLTGQHRNTQRRPVPPADIEEQKLKRRLVYRRLRLDGWSVNHKRVHRIWREEGLVIDEARASGGYTFFNIDNGSLNLPGLLTGKAGVALALLEKTDGQFWMPQVLSAGLLETAPEDLAKPAKQLHTA